MTVFAAGLTWNLIGGTLFIGLPSEPVDRVCVEETCVVPDNSVCVVLTWDGPPPVVYAKRTDGTWLAAVPVPVYEG